MCTFTFKTDMHNRNIGIWFIISDMKGKIRVYCRLRPIGEKEIAERERDVVTTVDEFTIEHPWKDDKPKQHLYDRVFNGDATQEEVFEDTRVSLA
jgi:hypothetical protein